MPPQPLLIRPARADDAAAIAQVVNAAYRPAPGKEGWTHESALVAGERTCTEAVAALIAASDNGSVVLAGLMDDAPVACVLIEQETDGAHIGMLAVAPTLQTAGLGRRLLGAAEDWARDRLGADTARLTVIGARPELKAFYLRRGYRDSGRRIAYPAGGATGQPRQDALELHILEKTLRHPAA